MSLAMKWGFALSILAFALLFLLDGTRRDFVLQVTDTLPVLVGGEAPRPAPRTGPPRFPMPNEEWSFDYVPFLRPVDWNVVMARRGAAGWQAQAAQALLEENTDEAVKHAERAVAVSRGNLLSLVTELDARLRALGLFALPTLTPAQLQPLDRTAARARALAPDNAYLDLFAIASLIVQKRQPEALQRMEAAARKPRFETYSGELAGLLVGYAQSRGVPELQARLAARETIAARVHPRLMRQVTGSLSRAISELPTAAERNRARLALLALAGKGRRAEKVPIATVGYLGAERVAGLLEDPPQGWGFGRFLTELTAQGQRPRGLEAERQLAESAGLVSLLSAPTQEHRSWQRPLLGAGLLWFRLAAVVASILILLALAILFALVRLAFRGAPASWGRLAGLTALVSMLAWLLWMLFPLPEAMADLGAVPIERSRFFLLALVLPAVLIFTALVASVVVSRRGNRRHGWPGALATCLADLAPWMLFASLVVFFAVAARLDDLKANGQAELQSLASKGEMRRIQSGVR